MLLLRARQVRTADTLLIQLQVEACCELRFGQIHVPHNCLVQGAA
jgi:hypothetical protein